MADKCTYKLFLRCLSFNCWTDICQCQKKNAAILKAKRRSKKYIIYLWRNFNEACVILSIYFNHFLWSCRKKKSLVNIFIIWLFVSTSLFFSVTPPSPPLEKMLSLPFKDLLISQFHHLEKSRLYINRFFILKIFKKKMNEEFFTPRGLRLLLKLLYSLIPASVIMRFQIVGRSLRPLVAGQPTIQLISMRPHISGY